MLLENIISKKDRVKRESPSTYIKICKYMYKYIAGICR